jgi:hypothetical protein
MTLESVRRIALALPGVEEGTSYCTPGFRVRGKLFARMHHELRDTLVIRIDPDERAMRMRTDPESYFITDHYIAYPWMLVRLASVSEDNLHDLIVNAWCLCAPARLIQTYQMKHSPSNRKTEP